MSEDRFQSNVNVRERDKPQKAEKMKAIEDQDPHILLRIFVEMLEKKALEKKTNKSADSYYMYKEELKKKEEAGLNPQRVSKKWQRA